MTIAWDFVDVVVVPIVLVVALYLIWASEFVRTFVALFRDDRK